MTDREQIDKIKAELLPTVNAIEGRELGRLRYTARRLRRERMIQRWRVERALHIEAKERGYGMPGIGAWLLSMFLPVLIPAAKQAIKELLDRLFRDLNDKLDEWDATAT